MFRLSDSAPLYIVIWLNFDPDTFCFWMRGNIFCVGYVLYINNQGYAHEQVSRSRTSIRIDLWRIRHLIVFSPPTWSVWSRIVYAHQTPLGFVEKSVRLEKTEIVFMSCDLRWMNERISQTTEL